MAYPRAAFLPDTFHEVNGVAHTSRHLEAFAKRRQTPFLSIHCGPNEERVVEGPVTVLQLKRGPAKFGLDTNLDYDPFLFRYFWRVRAELERFEPDIIHVTGPGDLGRLGCRLARQFKIPLVISWHTNLHEYACRRLERMLAFLGRRISHRLGAVAEVVAWRILASFYRKASIVFAPNMELVEVVAALSARPVFLMKRGVDTGLFSPAKRNRITKTFRLGYVGRLTAEKNVRFLADLGNALRLLGREDFEIVIVGEGREENWLRAHVPTAILTGVLRGEALAQAFANLDLLVFPSRTDTFGNVVLEAFCSGVPAVVTARGGPKFLIQPGVTGWVAESDRDFIGYVNQMMTDVASHRQMRLAAREYALGESWDAVFEQVFRAYGMAARKRVIPEQMVAEGRI